MSFRLTQVAAAVKHLCRTIAWAKQQEQLRYMQALIAEGKKELEVKSG